MFCDNINTAVYLSTNPVQHQCTKHVDIDLHFDRDKIANLMIMLLSWVTCSENWSLESNQELAETHQPSTIQIKAHILTIHPIGFLINHQVAKKIIILCCIDH